MITKPGSEPAVGAVRKTVNVVAVEPEYGIISVDVMDGVIPGTLGAGDTTMTCPGVVPVGGTVIDVTVGPR